MIIKNIQKRLSVANQERHLQVLIRDTEKGEYYFEIDNIIIDQESDKIYLELDRQVEKI